MAKKVKSDVVDNKPASEETLEEKYDRMVDEIRPHLMTSSQLRQGGSANRARYEKEKGYESVIAEINEIGRKIGRPKIGLGHLRD